MDAWVHYESTGIRDNSDMKTLSHLMLCLSCPSLPIGTEIKQRHLVGCFSICCAPASDISVLNLLFTRLAHLPCSFCWPYTVHILGNCWNINSRNEGAQLNLVQFWEITQSKQKYNNLQSNNNNNKKYEILGSLNAFFIFIVRSSFKVLFFFSFLR